MKFLLTLFCCFLFSQSFAQSEFITTWKTDNPGVSEDNQITIPTYKAPNFLPQVTYDYNVDWGDGSVSENVTGDIIHTYAIPGVYQVSITGIFPRIFFENTTNSKDVRKIIEINQWGSNQWISMSGAFSGCENIDVKATDIPNFSGLNDVSKMFKNCSSLIGNNSMDNWDLSKVTQMGLLFFEATQFNQPIGSWNVSNVESMFSLFQGASSFNQDISNWDVVSVDDMRHMFFDSSFNHNIGNWNVSKVTYMSAMFSQNQVFNQDISGWDVSKVKWMTNMFTQASAFNQDLSSWNVESVENMNSMFFSALSFNQNLGEWNVGNVNDMSFMLSNTGMSTENYDSTLSGWSNLPSLKNGVRLDSNNQYCEGGIDRQKIIEVYNWFINDGGLLPGCTAKQKRPFIMTWQVESSPNNNITIPTFPEETYDYSVDWGDGNSDSNITSDITHEYINPGIYKVSISGEFPRIYFDTVGLNPTAIINIDQWGDISWSSMEGAFSNCINLNVSAMDVPDLSGVTSANQMFNNCQALKGNPSFDNWDVSNLQNVAQMFAGTHSFNQILPSWDTSNINTMYQMFYESAFNNSIGNWNISNVNSLTEIFEGSALSTVNYDNTLISWSYLNVLQPNLTFDAGTSQFCNSASARQSIIEEYNWTINDSGENCPIFQPFVTTWKTDNPGTSDNNTIVLLTSEGSFDIDWGDGNIETDVFGAIEHSYSNAGIYTVSISGGLGAIRLQYFEENEAKGDANKLIEINQWGDIKWTSMSSAFSGCTNLDVVAWDAPDLSNVNSLFYMFDGCKSLTDSPSFNDWDISTIENLIHVFNNCNAFNANISNWDVSKVARMDNLFQNCSEFNQDISNWNVGNVTHMGGMFSNATKFNQPIGSWDVSNVTNMSAMFQSSEFNQDISNWDVGNVLSMSFMFNLTPKFNQNIGNWNVSNVTDMSNMLSSTGSFNQDISNWDVFNVTNMRGMFANARVFNQDIGNWNVSNVTNMIWLFIRANTFDQNLANWNISQVTDMTEIFNFSGLSNYNYNSILASWSQLPSLQRAVPFDALQNQFCESEDARQILLDNYNWIINDDGRAPFCNEDNDLDGVLDHKDNCLNTRPNVTVNDNGCEVIPSDAILVYGSTPTCPGQSNGNIAISSSLVNYVFNISIDGPVSSEYANSFLNEPLEITNLSAGAYSVTISIPDISYSQTYGIQINEVGSISGKRDYLDTNSKSASYTVEGSYSYKVDLNGVFKTFQFETDGFNEIQLSDLTDFNTITISGESDCQGLISDSFSFSDGIVIYPTITKNSIYMEGYDEQSTVLVYDSSGRLLIRKKLTQQNLESVNLDGLEAGMYPTVIESKGTSKTFKIIKQ